MTPLLNLNYELFQGVNNYATQSPLLDTIMIFCADWLIFALVPLLLLLWGIPLTWRRAAIVGEHSQIVAEKRAIVLWTAIACAIAYGTNLLIEQFIAEPRPFVSHHVHLIIKHAADSAFPSDHTAVAFAVASMLGLNLFAGIYSTNRLYRRGLRWFFLVSLLLALAVGFARIFVGVHYPGDILGGIMTGLLAALIATLLRLWLQRPTQVVITLLARLRLA